MEHNAIPTMYSGVRLRSRLEARWAAWFDLVGWSWRYAPPDLGGLLVAGQRGLRLVAVEPESDHANLMPHGAKIDASGWTGLAAIVGSAPGVRASGDGFELGVIRHDQPLSPRWWENWGAPWVMVPARGAMAAWIAAGDRVLWRGVEAEPEELAEGWLPIL